MPFVPVLGIDLHYVEHGPADAERTAVFLHGFPLDHRLSVATFEASFAARPNWRRLYPDFPGMGRTKAPDWVGSTDDIFRVAAAFVDEMVPGAYALGGTSFGGCIAAGLAATTPDRVAGLALIVPMVRELEGRNRGVHEILLREDGITGSEIFESMAVIRTAETRRRTSEEVEAAVDLADAEAVERIEANYAPSFPLTPPSGRFERPGLVITGRQDDVLGFNDQWQLYGQWPRTTFAVLDRGGHGLAIELKTTVDALVGDWLDRVETDPGQE